MAQAKIYWDLGDYQQVEKIFRKSVEFCSEHDVWKLNVAHVLFMQVSWTNPQTLLVGNSLVYSQKETKFKEAAGFYEAIVKKNYDNVSLNIFWVSRVFTLHFILSSYWASVLSFWPTCVSLTSWPATLKRCTCVYTQRVDRPSDVHVHL